MGMIQAQMIFRKAVKTLPSTSVVAMITPVPTSVQNHPYVISKWHNQSHRKQRIIALKRHSPGFILTRPDMRPRTYRETFLAAVFFSCRIQALTYQTTGRRQLSEAFSALIHDRSILVPGTTQTAHQSRQWPGCVHPRFCSPVHQTK